MKNILLLAACSLVFISCKDNKKEEELVIHDTVEISEMTKKTYPKEIAAIFEAHGGLATWKEMNNLCFEIDGRNGTEVHSTSLGNRMTKIETDAWSIGYDGNEVWLLNNDPKKAYQGNARFYHNLMFYFYSMPFILSDDGIQYENLPMTELDGKKYAGIKISYNDGVGNSSDDEYILYYNPDSNQMEWLGYTVTFGKENKNDDWHFIKYDQWQSVNGLMLPKKLTWYNVENNKPTDERNDMLFSKVTATETIIPDSVFAKPEGAIVVE